MVWQTILSLTILAWIRTIRFSHRHSGDVEQKSKSWNWYANSHKICNCIHQDLMNMITIYVISKFASLLFRHKSGQLIWQIEKEFCCVSEKVNFIFCINTMATLQRFQDFKVHNEVCCEISKTISGLIHLIHLIIFSMGLWYDKNILVRNSILNKNDIVFCTDILRILINVRNRDY